MQKQQKYSISVNLKFKKKIGMCIVDSVDSDSLAAVLIDVLWVDLEV